MKCFNHNNNEAIGICVNCGKALCNACITKSEKDKITCSDACARSITKFENTIDIIQSKTLKQNRTAAYGCYVSGAIFSSFGAFHLFFAKSYFAPLGIFLIVLGMAFFLWGTWYLKTANKQIP